MKDNSNNKQHNNSKYQNQNSQKEINVFTCPSCKSLFNKNKRIPINLPCGHVICKECIKNNLCPIDELIFNYENSNFPICQTILQYLPEEKVKKFLCKCFEHKRIKFICEYDNEMFCSNCCVKHNNSPHKIFPFNPNIISLSNELQNILNNAENRIFDLNEKINYISDLKNKLNELTDEQIKELNLNYNHLINELMKHKNFLEDRIKEIYNSQKGIMKNCIDNIIKEKENINNLSRKIINLLNHIENNNEIYYDKCIKDKNEIIKNWENFLKNSTALSTKLFHSDLFRYPIIKYTINESILNEIISIKSSNLKEKSKTQNDFYVNDHKNNNNIKNNCNYFTDSTHEKTTRNSNPSTKRKESVQSNHNTNNNENKFFGNDIKRDYKPILMNDSNDKYKYVALNLRTNNNYNSNTNFYKNKLVCNSEGRDKKILKNYKDTLNFSK